MKLPESVNILLLGGGGRECAFARKIAQSPKLGRLFIAPGNGGTDGYGMNVDINPLDFSVVGQFVVNNHINLVVVGPEEPLVRGIKDFFIENEDIRHIAVLGPSGAAAALEGSKDFAKDFMVRHNIPTARYLTVTSDTLEQGYEFLESLSSPYVLKADGLAAGKGVLIIDDLTKAKEQLRDMIVGKKFGDASVKVVIEEFLSGIEMSVFVATDSVGYKILPSAKDYKRVGQGDTGLNTGGMG
ncbi:MAG: phosphoribosylamine--glycine ligase, partial [Mucinivorans sp.]